MRLTVNDLIKEATGKPLPFEAIPVRLKLLTEETNVDRLEFRGVLYEDGELHIMMDSAEEDYSDAVS